MYYEFDNYKYGTSMIIRNYYIYSSVNPKVINPEKYKYIYMYMNKKDSIKFVHTESPIIGLSPEMAVSRGSRHYKLARLVRPIEQVL